MKDSEYKYAENLKEENKQLRIQYNLKCLLMDEAHLLISKYEKEIKDLLAKREKDIGDAWDAAEEWFWAKGTHSEKYTTNKATYIEQVKNKL
jgi:hypothetical protein